MNKPNTQVASCETWRRYGVMVHDTTDTLGGMHRIEIKPDHGAMIPCGPAVAFTFTQEQADRIVKAVNCHDDLLSACKVAEDFIYQAGLHGYDPYKANYVIAQLMQATQKAKSL